MHEPIAVPALFLGCLVGAVEAVNAERERTGWEIDALLGVESEPAYAGSDVYEAELDGELSATYRAANGNEYFIGLGELGTRVPFGSDWIFSALLEYEEGRDNADDPILRGFRTVDDTVEAQIGLVRTLGSWSLGAVFQPDVLRRGKGLVYFVGIGHERRLFERVRLRSTWDVSWGDAEHMDTEFGVNADESRASGLAEYRPASGLKSTTLAFQTFLPLVFGGELVLGLELENYLGAAADSPLIEDAGSAVTYEAGVGIAFELL